MTVYVEYAFLENFLLDGMLLYLSFHAAKTRLSWKKLLFSAALGGAFALFFPLLILPPPLEYFLKFAFAFLLCLLAFPRLKSKKDVGRYALTCACFFFFSFALAGAIFGLYSGFAFQEGGYFFGQLPFSVLLIFACCLFLLFRFLLKKIYEKRALHSHIYDCAILYNKRRVAILGYLDSGNLASKFGVPVCFVSPDIVFDFWENEYYSPQEFIAIETLGGEKTLPLYCGELEIKVNNKNLIKKQVYFAPSAHIVSREYKMLLQANILD